MKTAILKKNGITLIQTVELAVRFGQRMKGLLGRSSLGESRALHISSCSSIHTFFMKFDLDLVFLDAEMKVERIVTNVPAYRIVYGGINARSVIEMESGWFPEDALKPGDKISLDPCS